MLVRFGYVAIALGIQEGSPNKAATVKTIEKIDDPEGRINRLRRISRENLAITLRILRYNRAHQIHLYRFTSKTIPLPTHPIAAGWDYRTELAAELAEIGEYIRTNSMRVSAHPDHYTLLNSPKSDVLAAALLDLDYHVSMLEGMGLPPEPQLVIHVGGLYKNKDLSLQRFLEEFEKLPDRLRLRLLLENDDKVYDARDILDLSVKTGQPMVLDIHHHACTNHGESIADLWEGVVKTWGDRRPKIHVSSSKSLKDCRSHADFINIDDFLPFLKTAKEIGQDFDVMVEAKQKDLAMFQLLDDLENIDGIKRVEQATIEL